MMKIKNKTKNKYKYLILKQNEKLPKEIIKITKITINQESITKPN